MMTEDEIGRQIVDVAVRIHLEIGCGVLEKHGNARIVNRIREKHRWAPWRSRLLGESIYLFSVPTHSAEGLIFL